MSTRDLTRRDMLRLSGAGLIVSAVPTLSLFSCASTARFSPPTARPYAGTDEQLLDEIERAAFDYFWTETNPETGQVKDRAFAKGGGDRPVASIAATGFGLTGLCIGDRRGYRKSADITQRVRNTLQFLATQVQHQHGFFYHFTDMNSGERQWNCEISSIDTALLLCGVLTARQYFEKAISLQRDHNNAINNLGVLYMKTGHMSDAIAAFQYGLEAVPDDDMLYLNMVRAYISTGDRSRARATLQRALAIENHRA